MKKVALLLLVLVVGGCGDRSKTSLGDDNLELARQFLAFASSDENRAQALDMADENFEFRWMGLLPDENGELAPGLVFDKQGYFDEYWKLVDEFRKITNTPVVLNTSFNDNDEPIVCTPKDAIRTFFGLGLHELYIGNYRICKSI